MEFKSRGESAGSDPERFKRILEGIWSISNEDSVRKRLVIAGYSGRALEEKLEWVMKPLHRKGPLTEEERTEFNTDLSESNRPEVE